MRRLKKIVIDVSALRASRGFRWFFVGTSVTTIGAQVTLAAMMWQVFDLTGSSLAVGGIGVAFVIPTIVIGLWGGALADSMDRKRLLIMTQAGVFPISVLLAVLATGEPPLWLLYGLTVLSASLHAVEGPTKVAAIPMLVGDRQLTSAVQLREVVTQSSRLIGPFMAGLVIASYGLTAAYAIDAATYVIALMAFSRLPRLAPETATKAGWASVVEGFRYLRKARVLAATFYADLIAMIVGMPRAVFPAFAVEVYDVGPTGFGLMLSAVAAGGVAGTLVSGWTTHVQRQGLGVLISISVFGAAIVAFGMTDVFIAGLILLGVAGWADMISAIFRQAMLLEIVPDELRGRMGSVHTIVVAGGPAAGDLESGALAEAIGLRPSVIAGGVACIAGMGFLAWRIPEFARWRPTPAGESPTPPGGPPAPA